MKTITLFILIVLISFKLNAQSAKSDSAFYLLDTSKTIPTDKLWHTYKEGLVKFYQLEIYAVNTELMNKPTFAYSSHYQKPVPLSNDQFKSIKLSSLSELILKLKQFAEADMVLKDDNKKPFYLYLIEHKANGYIMVKTQLDGSGPKKVVN